MSTKRRIFSKEFKLNAKKLYLKGDDGGCKIPSRNLGINDHKLLLRWVQKYKN